MAEFIKTTSKTGDQVEVEVLETYDYEGRVFCVVTEGFQVGVFDKLTGGKVVWFTGYPEPIANCIEIAKRRAHDTLTINPGWKELLKGLLIVNPQPVEPAIVEDDQPATYAFADTVDGDLFTITTPELGTVEVVATRQALGPPPMVGIHFGHIKTPLACLSRDGQTNAHLQFYSSGTGYNSLRMVYTCSCSFDNHSHALEWFDLSIDGQTIKTDVIGNWLSQPHNHPLVEQFAHLAPAPVTKSVTKSITKPVTKSETIPFKNIPRAEPKPVKEVAIVDDPKVNGKGQFQLF